jgi:uncharacterized membrane protein HdeD (DUF308 family)
MHNVDYLQRKDFRTKRLSTGIVCALIGLGIGYLGITYGNAWAFLIAAVLMIAGITKIVEAVNITL